MKKTYSASLELTKFVLTQQYFLTPAALSRLLRCSKPTVYSRIGALERMGVKVEQSFHFPTQKKHPGPKSLGFRILPESKD